MAEAIATRADAELAALRAEVERLKVERDAALAEGAVIGRMNAMKDAQAEIGQLREALKKAEEGLDTALGMVERSNFIPSWDFLRECRTAARAALEPKP